MSKQEYKTKKGAAAVYIVIFTATLLSIIALSFIRLMITESGRTTNYSLSQSAYNSALAGIEDAKIVLLKAQSCIGSSSTECKQLTSLIDSGSCDMVGKILGYNTDNNETIIKSKSDQSMSSSAKDFDQAYTCVKISQRTKDYLTTLTADRSIKLIPIRTNGHNNQVNRILISWFSRENYTSISSSLANYASMSSSVSDTAFNAYAGASGTYGYTNGEVASVAPPIQLTLIQTDSKFKLSQFYSNVGNTTNRGTITLRPTTSTSTKVAKWTNGSNHIDTVSADSSTTFNTLAYSANKSINSPIDVHCDLANNSGYACVADITVPQPVRYSGSTTTRNDNTMFLVVNQPYGDPETEVSVELKHCVAGSGVTAQSVSVFDSKCSSVNFVDAQSVVDSTGRANDLFRRVEARIELSDPYFPITSYALAVNDPEGDDDNIEKSFYVTGQKCNYVYTSNGTVYNKTCSPTGTVGN